MTLKELSRRFNTEAKCKKYLHQLRWPSGVVTCVRCKSSNVRFNEGEDRYACNHCKARFRVTTDTIFERSPYPLDDWFRAIFLILNAKQGYSAKQLERNLGCTYKTAWYMAMRIRCAMIDPDITLQDVVEMDETYVGGKPRKRKALNDSVVDVATLYKKRGRGTNKTAVVGIVQRKGKVVLEVAERLTSRYLLAMLKRHVVINDQTIVMTDDFSSYKKFDEYVTRQVIKHSQKQYSDGDVHTNTIEGFWTIVKNSIRGEYRVISRKYLPFYLVQAQYIYNRQHVKANHFEDFMKTAVIVDKDDYMMAYKPIADVKKLVYPIRRGRKKKRDVA
ncbi:MAG: IS1595 family transposase [Spirosomataceae bacterium]